MDPAPTRVHGQDVEKLLKSIKAKGSQGQPAPSPGDPAASSKPIQNRDNQLKRLVEIARGKRVEFLYSGPDGANGKPEPFDQETLLRRAGEVAMTLIDNAALVAEYLARVGLPSAFMSTLRPEKKPGKGNHPDA